MKRKSKKPPERKPFLLSLDEGTRKALDALIRDKRRIELFSKKECNLQTEGAAAIRIYIESERAKLKDRKPPTRIM